jgi:hypothetical protein
MRAERTASATYPAPVYSRLFAVTLMAFTSPTLAALILRLLVLSPGPSTTVPEPLLVTDSKSPPEGGMVTCKERWPGNNQGV